MGLILPLVADFGSDHSAQSVSKSAGLFPTTGLYFRRELGEPGW